VIFSTDAERDRAFFQDVLGFPSVDAGGGWLILGLPPAELAAHPAEQGGQHELYLMCDDVHGTVAELRAKGVDIARPISDEGFGPVTAIRLPGGGELGLYQPPHPSPLLPDRPTSSLVDAPMADIQAQARLRDFALSLLGGAPPGELEPGPAPPLTGEAEHLPGLHPLGAHGWNSETSRPLRERS
jgi:catechol 2,3-dioxygenase-like lactoylglutathione lyase family enzyme